MELNVLNIKGEETGRKVTLDDAIFGIEPNDHAIYLDVKSHMANRRSGTAKTKGRSENAHSTRKLFRQKGTGGARRGDTKSPILIGGGTIFGPRPRDYEQKVNRKTKRLARLSALTYKAKDNAIVVVEDFTMDTYKTKDFAAILKALKIEDKKDLFLLYEANDQVRKSGANISNVTFAEPVSVNTYKVLDADRLVFSESGLKALVAQLSGEEK
ncbi:MAG: 50S ribosomal protein L4 [Porphyromonas sp.]|uniref:50S ribosomal protein L4 n=1 Tax=Porphyromonas sp. TaxID=1924944 RepID=UPI002A9094A8|nr:50S ribosomal protein L4 [Porphyromonas sp.]MDD7468887.1 50S ribosomal protein L4 [Bacteroidales bacterium]MDY6102332.1 50S ribosomal protein L4 [Porphyromonas sp.]